MGKHRHERFRDAYAVVRIDGFTTQAPQAESVVTVKEVWLSQEQADREVERLNALVADATAPSSISRSTRGSSATMPSSRKH
jgi:hypothetical protein